MSVPLSFSVQCVYAERESRKTFARCEEFFHFIQNVLFSPNTTNSNDCAREREREGEKKKKKTSPRGGYIIGGGSSDGRPGGLGYRCKR